MWITLIFWPMCWLKLRSLLSRIVKSSRPRVNSPSWLRETWSWVSTACRFSPLRTHWRSSSCLSSQGIWNNLMWIIWALEIWFLIQTYTRPQGWTMTDMGCILPWSVPHLLHLWTVSWPQRLHSSPQTGMCLAVCRRIYDFLGLGFKRSTITTISSSSLAGHRRRRHAVRLGNHRWGLSGRSSWSRGDGQSRFGSWGGWSACFSIIRFTTSKARQKVLNPRLLHYWLNEGHSLHHFRHFVVIHGRQIHLTCRGTQPRRRYMLVN